MTSERSIDRDRRMRQHLLELLGAGAAHVGFDEAVKDLPTRLRGARPPGQPHTPWRLIEHMRIAQSDILEFCRGPAHISPDWPAGYWPATDAPPNTAAWKRSIDHFRADLKAMQDLVADESVDLLAPIPHGQGQTILREAILLADHNAYHLGQLILLRRLLGAWRD